MKENILVFRALEKDGSIDGFMAYSVQADRITATALGYDCSLPQEMGIYRMLIALAISEAAGRNTKLNLGGGVGYFKTLRGAVAVEDYDAVYDRHLPSYRRLGWATLRMAGRLASRQRQITL